MSQKVTKPNAKKPAKAPAPQQEYIGKDFTLDEVDKQIMSMRLQHVGITDAQIAKELNYSREQVNRRQQKPAFKAAMAHYSRSAKQILEDSLSKAALKFVALMDCKKPATERLAARDILVNGGVLKLKLDIDHHFSEPFIVERTDGKQTVMGQREKDDKATVGGASAGSDADQNSPPDSTNASENDRD